MQQRALPGDERAPVVADHHRGLGLVVVEQAGEVAADVVDLVVLDLRRRVAAAEAAQVGRHRAVARRRERRELMPPRVPRLRPAVEQHHQRTLAALGDAQRDLADVDAAQSVAEDGLAHWRLLRGDGRDRKKG